MCQWNSQFWSLCKSWIYPCLFLDCIYVSAFPFLLSTLIACLGLSGNHPVFSILNEKAYLFWSRSTWGTPGPRRIQPSFVCRLGLVTFRRLPLHQVYDKSRWPPVRVMETGGAPWGLRCHHCKNKPVCRLSVSHLSNNLRALFQLLTPTEPIHLPQSWAVAKGGVYGDIYRLLLLP